MVRVGLITGKDWSEQNTCTGYHGFNYVALCSSLGSGVCFCMRRNEEEDGSQAGAAKAGLSMITLMKLGTCQREQPLHSEGCGFGLRDCVPWVKLGCMVRGLGL